MHFVAALDAVAGIRPLAAVKFPVGCRTEIPMLSIIVVIDHYYVAWAPTLNLNSTVRY